MVIFNNKEVISQTQNSSVDTQQDSEIPISVAPKTVDDKY